MVCIVTILIAIYVPKSDIFILSLFSTSYFFIDSGIQRSVIPFFRKQEWIFLFSGTIQSLRPRVTGKTEKATSPFSKAKQRKYEGSIFKRVRQGHIVFFEQGVQATLGNAGQAAGGFPVFTGPCHKGPEILLFRRIPEFGH